MGYATRINTNYKVIQLQNGIGTEEKLAQTKTHLIGEPDENG